MNVLEKSFLSFEVSVLMAFRGFQEKEGVNATVTGGYWLFFKKDISQDTFSYSTWKKVC